MPLVDGPPEMTPEEVVWEYCANEMHSGYPCRTEGCPHCGGPEKVKDKDPSDPYGYGHGVY